MHEGGDIKLTVVVFRMISGSSLSSGTTSSTSLGTVGGAGGGARGVIAAFLALEKNLKYTGNTMSIDHTRQLCSLQKHSEVTLEELM